MNDPVESRTHLPVSFAPVYWEAAIEYRREHGWGDPLDNQDPATKRFNQQVKDFFQDALVRVYWARLRDHLWDKGESVAKILDINEGRESRWNSFADGKNIYDRDKSPTLKNFLMLISLPGIAMEDVGFPNGSQATCYGIVEALVRIRNEKLGPDPLCPPQPPSGRYTLSPMEFAWLYHILETPDWLNSRAGERQAQECVLDQINREIMRHFPESQSLSITSANNLIFLWSKPWLLFVSVDISESLVRGITFEKD